MIVLIYNKISSNLLLLLLLLLLSKNIGKYLILYFAYRLLGTKSTY